MPNINLPLGQDLLERIDKARGLVPRTAWIRDAVTAKLDVPSILDQPMIPVPRETKVEPLRGGETKLANKPPVNPVSPPTQEYLDMKKQARQLAEKDCEHKYRDRHNVCIACGHQRPVSVS